MQRAPIRKLQTVENVMLLIN